MILLDTNVLIYAFDPSSPYSHWSSEIIAEAVAGDGAAINAVSLAELCVGDEEPETVADRIRGWGVEILDVPAAAAGLLHWCTCQDHVVGPGYRRSGPFLHLLPHGPPQEALASGVAGRKAGRQAVADLRIHQRHGPGSLEDAGGLLTQDLETSA